MKIRRDMYLDRLITRKGNGMAKVITGVRRSGKSFLMNELFYQHLIDQGVDRNHIIRFAFDSADDLAKIHENPVQLALEKRKVDPLKFCNYIDQQIRTEGEYYLLLDEIQLMDAFESVINSYLRDRRLDLYVTGSNSKFLSSDIITEFRGREMKSESIHFVFLNSSQDFMEKNGRHGTIICFMADCPRFWR